MKTKTQPESDDPLEDTKRWWHKPHWQLLLGVVFVLVLVIAVQCFYPYGKSFPTARVGNVAVENLSREAAVEKLYDAYKSVPLTVTIPGVKPITTTTVAAGIVPNYKLAADKVTEYSLAERFVPFSFVSEVVRSQVPLGYTIEPELFAAFTQQVAEACKKEPQDASIAFKGGKAELIPAVNGRQCDAATVRKSLETLTLHTDKNQVAVTPQTIPARRSDTDMRSQLLAANETIEKGLKIGTPAESWAVPAETIADWLTASETDGTLQTKPEAIKDYLDKQRGKLHVEPGVTTVKLVDNVEVERVVGTQGQGIDLSITEARITDVLLGRSQGRTAWAQLTVLPAREEVQRQYSASHQGVQALIEQWDREHNGRYGIIVRDLSDKGWNAELLPDRDFVTASTYKMFLAYAVLHKVEQDELKMETTTDIGLSVKDCIEEMILHSTNACATSLMNLAGWSYVHNFILGQFPGTRLDNGANSDGEKHTTVRDEVTFMHRLHLGQLMSEGNTQYLLSLFKRQVYRKGIPSGVPGVAVADKVGFYNGYKHDVGIVYAPSGTYIIGIMSYGGADWEFADLSRKVHDLMKQR